MTMLDRLEQWRAIEDGEPRTSWYPCENMTGDRPGWEALALRNPDKYRIETRTLVPLSTITPAEVGGLVDAQTEARAIARASLWVPAKPEHAKIGWTYDFEQTERISRAAYDSTGYDATMEVVEFVMAEADRRHDTALAAKDAELAEVKAECDKWREAFGEMHRQTMRAEAQLAEARKALASNASTFEAIRTHIDERSLPLARGLCSQGSFAARRALTGGKNG